MPPRPSSGSPRGRTRGRAAASRPASLPPSPTSSSPSTSTSMALSFEALGSEDVIMEEPPTRTRKRRVPDDAVDRELPASAPSASTAPAPPPVDTGYWQYLNRPSHPSPLGPFPTAGSSSPENGIVKMARLGVYILTLHPATAQCLSLPRKRAGRAKTDADERILFRRQSGKMPQQLPSNYDPTLPVCSNCTTQVRPSAAGASRELTSVHRRRRSGDATSRARSCAMPARSSRR